MRSIMIFNISITDKSPDQISRSRNRSNASTLNKILLLIEIILTVFDFIYYVLNYYFDFLVRSLKNCEK